MATKKEKTEKLPHDAVLQRAATFRALIMSFVKKNPGAQTQAITEGLNDKVTELKAPFTTIPGQLKVLRDTEQLVSIRDGHQLSYYLPEDKPRKVREPRAEKLNANVPFQVDIIRGSGRVRIQLAEFVIEIGVVDK